jgi:xanthine/uracil/vitamin C permease (AzgA family)
VLATDATLQCTPVYELASCHSGRMSACLYTMSTGIRGRIVSLVPKCIMLATAGGIGLFLAFIGLQNSEGVGLIQYNSATLVTLGELLVWNRT